MGVDGETASHVTAQARWEQSLIPGFRLNLKGGLLYSPMALPLFAAQPSSANVDILPSDFAADHYAGASAGLEKYLLKVKYGTLSVLAAYQAVYSSGPVLGGRLDHGVMAALRFYLARLAIPAVGLGMSYNVAADYWQGYFSIGMGSDPVCFRGAIAVFYEEKRLTNECFVLSYTISLIIIC